MIDDEEGINWEKGIHWYAARNRERGEKYRLAGDGVLYVQSDGSIRIDVEDDYYSGSLTVEEAHTLFDQLKAVFEP